jgi:hypothetical protein
MSLIVVKCGETALFPRRLTGVAGKKYNSKANVFVLINILKGRVNADYPEMPGYGSISATEY